MGPQLFYNSKIEKHEQALIHILNEQITGLVFLALEFALKHILIIQDIILNILVYTRAFHLFLSSSFCSLSIKNNKLEFRGNRIKSYTMLSAGYNIILNLNSKMSPTTGVFAVHFILHKIVPQPWNQKSFLLQSKLQTISATVPISIVWFISPIFYVSNVLAILQLENLHNLQCRTGCCIRRQFLWICNTSFCLPFTIQL